MAFIRLTHLVNAEPCIKIGFMGDIMLGRLVNEKISETSYAYPWGNLIPTLKKNDVNIANLETTLTIATKKAPKVFNFKASPDKVETLKAGHIDVVSLANNHILDFSIQGMQDTIQALDSAGIRHTGAGNTLEEAQKPVITRKKGITIGILGFTDNEPGWLAGVSKPGINYLEVGATKKIIPIIKKLRPKVDIVIVSAHWGPNMRERPTDDFKDFAHTLIDAGVDIFHGHSAHIVQPIERYKGKVIMYDTGDFIDDYAIDPELRNDLSALFVVTACKNAIKKVELIPVIIKNMQVRKASAQEAKEFKRLLKKRSHKNNQDPL